MTSTAAAANSSHLSLLYSTSYIGQVMSTFCENYIFNKLCVYIIFWTIYVYIFKILFCLNQSDTYEKCFTGHDQGKWMTENETKSRH